MSPRPVVLVVDDEPDFLASISERIAMRGMEPLLAQSGEEAVALAGAHRVDLAVVDYRMPGMDGLQAIARLRQTQPGVKTILLTGSGEEKLRQASGAVEAQYFEKNNLEGLWNALSALRPDAGMVIITPPADRERTEEGGMLTETVSGSLGLRAETFAPKNAPFPLPPKLIGETRTMLELRRNIAKVASLDCTVLIRGETGTGKELVARIIHRSSPRSEKKFLAVNCASFSKELLSNELFGHEREAFTGAHREKKGLFEAMRGGTILLDEIGDTPASMQAKLLRVLQEKTVIRVGGTDEIPVDVRVLASSNKSLRRKVEEGSFREDLFYRLNAFVLRIPPLRERMEDVALLSSYFLAKYRKEFGKRIEGISQDAQEALLRYPYPGNVRELENVIERAVILCEEGVIRPAHLPERIFQISPGRSPGAANLKSLAQVEEDHIHQVMAATGGNKNEASEILGISRTSLWRKLKRFDEDA